MKTDERYERKKLNVTLALIATWGLIILITVIGVLGDVPFEINSFWLFAGVFLTGMVIGVHLTVKSFEEELTSLTVKGEPK